MMSYLLPNSTHVMLHAIRGYPFVVDGLEKEARIGGVSESEAKLNNSFLKLLRCKNLCKTCQNYVNTLKWLHH